MFEMAGKIELNLLQECSLPYFILFGVVTSLSWLHHSLLNRIRTVYITYMIIRSW